VLPPSLSVSPFPSQSNTMGASEFLPSASNTDAFFHYDGSSSADTTPSHMLSPYVKANAPAGSWLVRSAAGDTAPFDNSCSLATVRPAETEGEGGQGVVGSAKAAWLSEDDRGFGTGTSTVVDETPLYTSIFRDELARQTGIGLPNDKCSEVPADSLDFADLLDHPAKRAATDRRRSELAAPADAPACSRAMVRHISAPVAASPLEGAEPLPGSHPPLLPAPIPPFIERVLSAPCACATGSAASGLAKAPWAQSGAPVAEGLSGNHVVQALGSRGAHTFGDLSVSRQGVVLTSTPGTTATTRSPLPSHSGDMPGVFPGCARPPFAALQQELLRLSDASRRLGYAPQVRFTVVPNAHRLIRRSARSCNAVPPFVTGSAAPSLALLPHFGTGDDTAPGGSGNGGGECCFRDGQCVPIRRCPVYQ